MTASRTSSVLRSDQTVLSRSSQWVASQAPPSTSGAHQAKAKSTIADASPDPRSTSPVAMNDRFTSMGGPARPLSNSLATVRSPVSSGSSR